MAAERRAIKKAARRHLKQQLLEELDATDPMTGGFSDPTIALRFTIQQQVLEFA